ncbi:hypothetical protein ACHQM5_024061 [Ranunculus cassubicifolius]
MKTGKQTKTTFLLVAIFTCCASIGESYAGVRVNPLTKYPVKPSLHVHSKAATQESLSKLPLRDQENLYVSSLFDEQGPFVDFPVFIARQDGLKEKDKIDKLPGQPIVNFDQYSGYVNLNGNENATRSFFYYFAECTDKPAEKPLVLWFNGGPGCSSFGAGALTELGPFRVKRTGKTLYMNEHSWNKKANILFIESPVGVGFSYSLNMTEYLEGSDNQTSADNYRFLINWLERFPEYKGRDLYLSGESYAGHYVPQFAHVILEKNKKPIQTQAINLKGIIIGNAFIDDYFHYKGSAEFYYSHAIISQQLKDEFYEYCQSYATTPGCSTKWMGTFDRAITGIDFYDIYAPLCNSSSNAKLNTIFDPCSANYVRSYLNQKKVQYALHANITGHLTYAWEDCSHSSLGTKWDYKRDSSVLPILAEVVKSGIRVWLYSGDVDGAVPVTSNQFTINALNLPIKTQWYPWTNNVEEVGGYAVEYQNLTFATVRGSGHFVPSNQPDRALKLFSSFLEGKLPPKAQIKYLTATS